MILVEGYEIEQNIGKWSIAKIICDSNEYYRYLMTQGNFDKYLPSKENGVLQLSEALTLLAPILRGLQDLRLSGYLHLNLKPTNVVITKHGNKIRAKLSDSGMFIVDNGNISPCSKNHLSPDFLEQPNETEKSDVWRIGVILFYMLNGVYPFNYKNQSMISIRDRCSPYSYAANSKGFQKLSQSKQSQLEELFSKFFSLNSQTRISPHEIKNSQLFRHRFSVKELQISKQIYAKEFAPKKITDQQYKQEWSNIPQQKFIIMRVDICLPSTLPQVVSNSNQMIPNPPNVISGVPKIYPNVNQDHQAIKQDCTTSKISLHPIILIQTPEQRLFSFEYQANKFLPETADAALWSQHCFPQYMKCALPYVTIKLYLIYAKRFYLKCINRQIPAQAPQGLNWEAYFSSKQFTKLIKQVEDNIGIAATELSILYDKCQKHLKKLYLKIPTFQAILTKEVTQAQFKGDFKTAYRYVTSYSYSALDTRYKELKKITPADQNTIAQIIRVHGMLIKVLICHSINKIFLKEFIPDLYQEYFSWKAKTLGFSQELDFPSFRAWLDTESVENLSRILDRIKLRIFKRGKPTP